MRTAGHGVCMHAGNQPGQHSLKVRPHACVRGGALDGTPRLCREAQEERAGGREVSCSAHASF